MTQREARLKIDGRIAQIVFINPDEADMDRAMKGALLDAVTRVEAEHDLHVCVLSGGSWDGRIIDIPWITRSSQQALCSGRANGRVGGSETAWIS